MVISPVNRRFDGILIEPERSRVRWTPTSFEFFSRGRACAVLSLETRDDEEEGQPPKIIEKNKGGIGRTSRKIEIDRSRVSIEFCARRFYIFQIFASDFQSTSRASFLELHLLSVIILWARLSKFISRDFAATRPTISNFLRCFSKG